jgi:hypothetical protein
VVNGKEKTSQLTISKFMQVFESVDCLKYLGLKVHSELSFGKHIDYIRKTINYKL